MDLVTKSAGSKGFSTYIYPTILYYGLRGIIIDGPNAGIQAWCWPGTQAFSSTNGGTKGIFPDTTSTAFYRIQQPSLLMGMTATLGTAPNNSNTVTVAVNYTPVGGIYTSTLFTLILTSANKSLTFFNSSVRLNTGDLLHLELSYTNSPPTTTAADLSVQLDLF